MADQVPTRLGRETPRAMRFFGRSSSRRSCSGGSQFVLYTRAGCHLCDAAKELLERYQRHWRFQLNQIDVDTDPALAKRFGDCVPVVTVDGEGRFLGGGTEGFLRRLLRAN